MAAVCLLVFLLLKITSVAAVGAEIVMEDICNCRRNRYGCLHPHLEWKSPINFDNSQLVPSENDIYSWWIFLNYYKFDSFILDSTDYSIVLTPSDGKNRSHRAPIGPYYNHTYDFHNVHIHFGKFDDIGSEHAVNFRSFPVEMHFLHWNVQEYSTVEEATGVRLNAPFVVVSVLLEKDTEGSNNSQDQISDMLKAVKVNDFNNGKVEIRKSLSLNSLFENQALAFSYDGSFTENKCTDNLLWYVLTKPVPCSIKLIQQLRRLWDGESYSSFRYLKRVGNRQMRRIGISTIRYNYTELN